MHISLYIFYAYPHIPTLYIIDIQPHASVSRYTLYLLLYTCVGCHYDPISFDTKQAFENPEKNTIFSFVFVFIFIHFFLSFLFFFQNLYNIIKELKESFNYGLFYPPCNGRAGKFLDEERPLSDYPFNGPGGYLEVIHGRSFAGASLRAKALRVGNGREITKMFLASRIV